MNRLALLAPALLVACTAGPDYVRPTAVTTPAFKEARPQAVSAPDAYYARGRWWELFGDRELNALVEAALANNQDVAASLAAYEQARGLVRETRANLFPTFGANATYTRSGVGAQSNRAGGVALGGSGDAFRLNAQASWAIDLFGGVRRGIESSRASQGAAASDLADLRLLIVGDLVQNYLQLRSQDADARLLRATVDAFARDLQITTNRYNAGIAARTDVEQARTQLLNAQVSARDIERTRGLLEHAVAVLAGRPPAELTVAPRGAWAPLAPAVPAVLPSELLRRRPDVAAAERRVQSANAQIGIEAAAFFPSLNLNANVGQTSNAISTLFNAAANTYSFGPALAQTIFDFGRRRARVAQARAFRDQATAQYRQSVLLAFRDVEDQLLATRVLRDEVGLADQAAAASRRAEALFRNQYKAGQVDYSQVIVAQTTALNTQRSAIQTGFLNQQAAVQLILALGGGWDVATADPPVQRAGAAGR